MLRPTVAVLVAAALAVPLACGDSDDEPRRPPPDDRLVVDLRVEVLPQGRDGPARTSRIRCAAVGEGADDPRCRGLADLDRSDLAPVPRDAVCTQIHGGPALASVRGTLRSRRVNASFDLRDGCEIARWRRNAELLGPPPTRAPGPRSPPAGR